MTSGGGPAALGADTWLRKRQCVQGKPPPLTAAGLYALRDQYTGTIAPARAVTAETLDLECTLSDLVKQTYNLTAPCYGCWTEVAACPPAMPSATMTVSLCDDCRERRVPGNAPSFIKAIMARRCPRDAVSRSREKPIA